jgi:hypothetical protein
MLKNISFIIVIALLISACEKGPAKQGGGKFGMLDSNVPEFAAIEFFEHVYHSKNLEGAIKLSTPKMERLIRSYHTNKSVQKHILNMRFDTVTIKTNSRSAGRNEFAKKAEVSLLFIGKLRGNIMKDLRVVELVKVDNDWKVDAVSLD